MAQTLTAVTPKLLAQGLMALREQAVMPLLVNRAYESLAGQQGSTIDVPIPSAIAAAEVTPAATPPSTADVLPTSVSIALDQWWEAPFYLSDKEMMTVMAGTIPMQASEAIKSLANKVNTLILAEYLGVYGFTGTPGLTPFGSGVETQSATGVRKVLNTQLAPLTDRRVVLDPDAEAAALDLRAFQDVSWTGDAAAIREGQLSRKLGFGWFMNQLVPSHTAGTLGGTVGDPTIIKAATAHAVGLKTLTTTTGATNAMAILEGDIITIAGQTQTYVATADAAAAAAADGAILIEPGLKVALIGSEALVVKGDHVVNIAFHRDAFAFATRPLEQQGDGLGAIIQSAADPLSGLTLRLEITREHKRTRFSYDILFGVQLVRAALAARLAG